MAEVIGGWWRDHPAYGDLVDCFRNSTRTPTHLAFLALAGLRRRGWDIVRLPSDTEEGVGIVNP